MINKTILDNFLSNEEKKRKQLEKEIASFNKIFYCTIDNNIVLYSDSKINIDNNDIIEKIDIDSITRFLADKGITMATEEKKIRYIFVCKYRNTKYISKLSGYIGKRFHVLLLIEEKDFIYIEGRIKQCSDTSNSKEQNDERIFKKVEFQEAKFQYNYYLGIYSTKNGYHISMPNPFPTKDFNIVTLDKSDFAITEKEITKQAAKGSIKRKLDSSKTYLNKHAIIIKKSIMKGGKEYIGFYIHNGKDEVEIDNTIEYSVYIPLSKISYIKDVAICLLNLFIQNRNNKAIIKNNSFHFKGIRDYIDAFCLSILPYKNIIKNKNNIKNILDNNGISSTDYYKFKFNGVIFHITVCDIFVSTYYSNYFRIESNNHLKWTSYKSGSYYLFYFYKILVTDKFTFPTNIQDIMKKLFMLKLKIGKYNNPPFNIERFVPPIAKKITKVLNMMSIYAPTSSEYKNYSNQYHNLCRIKEKIEMIESLFPKRVIIP